ncbi:hypothetical protein LGT39_05795 [Demequina sp. TTPB684]|uniref:hypothetical protein n=1 Tax=unclassified Demequina TaxID=2620311 RepID=UPI001CF5D820|nr:MULTISPECIES: hypothetical protein [unclassified Demequina]MCB2412360.1 hypothetical protein [Demequina sp. TTPB684]UPU89030.1 hypothetical protein LGT36_003650 [Demequina sp. TMPB413]
MFDEWQRGIGQLILAKRANGLYAATVGGATLSIPRQVAKTFIVGRIVFALCTLFPGLRVVWTAHRTRTATNTFQKLQGLAKSRNAAKYVKSIRVANGEQEIRFHNGSVILFGAREQGFGRGFDELDIEVFDEAQILTEKALEDMVAATNQSQHPHGALLLYMGTPPRPGIDPGEVFIARREEALSGSSRDSLYIECSAAPNVGRKNGPSLDDHKQWRIANPSFPYRTPLASMQRLRKNLPSDDSWRREALGVWDARGQLEPPVIDPEDWALLQRRPPSGNQVAYGIRFDPSGTRVALSVALADGQGCFVEGIYAGSPASSIDGLVKWLSSRWRTCDGIVIDGRGAADLLEARLKKERVQPRKITRVTPGQAGAAYAGLPDLVLSKSVHHSGQPGLAASIACSKKRKIGTQGAWGYEPNHPDGDSTPTEAAALAIFGLKTKRTSANGRTGQGRTSGGRRGTVM